MEIILWRHAEAEDAPLGGSDAARALTKRGHKQAEKMGRWLRERLPDNCRVLASPSVRTQQTVTHLERAFQTENVLAPGAAPEAVMLAVGWPRAGGFVLVVGHQPTLGRLAAQLLSGHATDWSIKKGAVVWIARRADSGRGCTLRAALTPDLL
ncbi:MAG: histidine phosphatase family protein [Betaproteobacteria bacterium]|nr:histidine phosphatase family protein [Betaproteobacteria bacterium]